MKSRLETVLQIALVLLVVAFILGQAIGQPVLVSYVETGSMEPTIEEGDGFVVIPAVLASSPESGDVIVFQAETLHNGSVTTHRVVGTAGDGYVTQGDANTFLDQEGDEPPVTDERILGKAVTVNDEIIIVPGLGRTIQAAEGSVEQFSSLPLVEMFFKRFGASSMTLLGFGLSLVGFGLVMGLGSRRTRDTSRTVRRRESFEVRRLSIILASVIVIAATAAMVLASGPVQYGLFAAEDPQTDDPMVLETGTVETVTHDISNGAFVPVVVVRGSSYDDVHVSPRATVIPPQSSSETSLQIDSPDTRERFDRTVSEHRYVAVLPASLLVALDAIHPWLAILAVDIVLALIVLLACAIIWPRKYIRVRSKIGRSPWRRITQIIEQNA